MKKLVLPVLLLFGPVVKAQWMPISGLDEFAFRKCSFVSNNVGYVIANWASSGSNWSVYKTADGGESWQPVTQQNPIQEAFFDLYFSSQNDGFLSTRAIVGPANVTQVLSTDNSGQNWNNVTTTPMEVGTGIGSLSGFGANFIAHAIGSSVYTSTNAGQNWIGYTFSDGSAPMDVSFFSDQIGAAALWDGTFLYGGSIAWTTDGGQIWQQLPSLGTYNKTISVQQFSATGIAALSEGSVFSGIAPRFYRTTNSGADWDTIPLTFLANIGQIGVDLLAFSPSTMYITSTNEQLGESHIYRTDDGGDNWTLDHTSPLPLNCMCQSPEGWIYAMSSEGVNYRTSDAVGEPFEIQDRKSVLFPNPASDVVNIGEKASKIVIITTLGRPVVQFDGPIDQFNVMDLPAGVYRALILSKNGKYTNHKLVIAH